MAIFLRFDNGENEFNMKARLKDETKSILRNALHKKTDMLMYLLRLLQHTFKKSTAVSIGSDMIKPVVLLRCDTILMEQLKKSLFFVFSLLDNGSLNEKNVRYYPQKTLKVVSSVEQRYRVTSQKKHGIYDITPY